MSKASEYQALAQQAGVVWKTDGGLARVQPDGRLYLCTYRDLTAEEALSLADFTYTMYDEETGPDDRVPF